ncbi:hypothetical protein C8Q78DRAFT_940268, partial [Trametes maxima]
QKKTIAQVAMDAQAAFLGFAFVSLREEQDIHISFGDVNKRALNPAKVRQLMVGFKDLSVRNWINPLPVLVRREWINVRKLTREPIQSTVGPEVEWQPAAKGQWVK